MNKKKSTSNSLNKNMSKWSNLKKKKTKIQNSCDHKKIIPLINRPYCPIQPIIELIF